MPNTHSTLTALFSDIADSIRSKAGTSAPIVADAFPAAIDAIPTGGGGDEVLNSILDRTISGSYTNSTLSVIGSSAFNGCSSLTSVNFPLCSYIGSYAFYGCSSLISANFPLCSYIGSNAFNSCSSLISANFPLCSYIGFYAFRGCSSLTSVNFPLCNRIGSYIFYNCSSLISVYFPVCSIIGSYAFNSCSSLTSVNFPVCNSIETYAFGYCSSLISAYFPVCSSIGMGAFYDCRTLLSLYLLGSSIPSLKDKDAFYNTPISNYTTSTGGVHGSIIVQASMLDIFKRATNWSIYSDRFSVWNGVD